MATSLDKENRLRQETHLVDYTFFPNGMLTTMSYSSVNVVLNKSSSEFGN